MKPSSTPDGERTPWFPARVNPVRCGIYEVKGDFKWERNHPVWSNWNGKFWGFRCSTFSHAVDSAHERALGPVTKWRGLARKP